MVIKLMPNKCHRLMDTFKGIIKSADFNVFIPTDDTHGTLAFYCYYTIPLINIYQKILVKS